VLERVVEGIVGEMTNGDVEAVVERALRTCDEVGGGSTGRARAPSVGRREGRRRRSRGRRETRGRRAVGRMVWMACVRADSASSRRTSTLV
jgi:ribosomal protein L19E